MKHISIQLYITEWLSWTLIRFIHAISPFKDVDRVAGQSSENPTYKRHIRHRTPETPARQMGPTPGYVSRYISRVRARVHTRAHARIMRAYATRRGATQPWTWCTAMQRA